MSNSLESVTRSAPIAPQPRSSLRSISLVTALTVVQLLLQFAMQIVLARYFGAAGQMDAYVAALALPVVVSTVISGSLGYVLVPAVAEQLVRGSRRDAATVACQIGIYLGTLSLLIAGGVAAGAVPLATLLCPGFSPAKQALTAALLRILSLLIVANSLIAYLNAVFHSFQRFTLPAVAGAIGTLVTLGYVMLLHDRQGIFAVAWGVVAGAVVSTAMLLPLFFSQLSQSAGWPLHAGTRQSLWLLTPLVLGALYWRLDPLLDRLLGSYLPSGSIAHIGYAWRLISGVALIGTSGLSIVSFPAIAAHAAARRQADMNAELSHALRFLLVLLIPVSVGLAGFATPVVRLLFEHGKFTSADSLAVSWLVMLYAGVILGAGLGDVLSRTLYAQQDMRTPVVISIIVFTIAAALKFALLKPLGASGLVVATSFYFLLNAAALMFILLGRQSHDMLAGVGSALARSVMSSLVAVFAASLAMRLPTSFAVLPAAACGAAVYGVSLWLLGDEFAVRFARRFLRG